MKVKIILFGQLADQLGTNELFVEDAFDSANMMNLLQQQFPLLKVLQFRIAVNNELITENTVLTENTTIALLPPFSGG